MIGTCYLHTVIDDLSRVAYVEAATTKPRRPLKNAVAGFAGRSATIKRVLSDNGSCDKSHQRQRVITVVWDPRNRDPMEPMAHHTVPEEPGRFRSTASGSPSTRRSLRPPANCSPRWDTQVTKPSGTTQARSSRLNVVGLVERGRPRPATAARSGLSGAVVDEGAHRSEPEPEPAFVGRPGVLLLRVRSHHRGKQIHDDLAAVAAAALPTQRPAARPDGVPGHRRERPGLAGHVVPTSAANLATSREIVDSEVTGPINSG